MLSRINTEKIKILHVGNSANNSYYNHLAFSNHRFLESHLPIIAFMKHAISLPAWEEISFKVSNYKWLDKPVWKNISGATQVNSILFFKKENFIFQTLILLSKIFYLRIIFKFLNMEKIYQFVNRKIQNIYTKIKVISIEDTQNSILTLPIFYGADFLNKVTPPIKDPWIAFEHGTLRWIKLGKNDQKELRNHYKNILRSATLILVTNLDPDTLEIAEDLFRDKWCAVPHPYKPIFDTLHPCELDWSLEVKKQTKSDFLIFMPSSINWRSDHDKGTMKALKSFQILRDSGVNVGLVLTEWGLQVGEAKIWLSDKGLQEHVYWMPPLPRKNLLQVINQVDICWDQFGLEAFGALSLRVCEVGTPMVSAGISREAQEIVGFQVPWEKALETEKIVDSTLHLITGITGRYGAEFKEKIRREYRLWLYRTHNMNVLTGIQASQFLRIKNGINHFEKDIWKNEIVGK